MNVSTKHIFILLCLIWFYTASTQRPHYVHWDYRYGGTSDDSYTKIFKLSDGGYIMSGTSNSGINGNKETPNWGGLGDYWVVRLDSLGNKLWDKTYGGTGADVMWGAVPTSDGGFLLGGYSGSGVNGDKTEPSRGGGDYWILKVDSLGNKLWDKTYGGNNQEVLWEAKECRDKGFILIGNSTSDLSGDKTENNAGPAECGWVVKTDSLGNKEWDQTFKNGGSAAVYMTSGIQTYDGGFMFGAETGLS